MKLIPIIFISLLYGFGVKEGYIFLSSQGVSSYEPSRILALVSVPALLFCSLLSLKDRYIQTKSNYIFLVLSTFSIIIFNFKRTFTEDLGFAIWAFNESAWYENLATYSSIFIPATVVFITKCLTRLLNRPQKAVG